MGATRSFVFTLKVRWCRPCICLLWGCPSCPEDVPWLSVLVVEHLVWVPAFSNRLKMFKNSFRGCEYCVLPYLQSKNLARTSQATQTAWSHFTCNFPKRLQKLCSKSVTKSWLQKNQSSMLSVFPNTDTTVWTRLNPFKTLWVVWHRLLLRGLPVSPCEFPGCKPAQTTWKKQNPFTRPWVNLWTFSGIPWEHFQGG